MKEYPCEVCKQMLNAGMVQSGIIIDGQERAAHVGCSDSWAAGTIEVYKITSPGNGSYYEEFPENVTEMLKESDEGSEYVVKKEFMTRGKYESLAEFQGF